MIAQGYGNRPFSDAVVATDRAETAETADALVALPKAGGRPIPRLIPSRRDSPRDSRRQLQVPALDPLPDGTAHGVRRRQRRRQDQPLPCAPAVAGFGRRNLGTRTCCRGRHGVGILGRQATCRRSSAHQAVGRLRRTGGRGHPLRLRGRDRRPVARRPRRLPAGARGEGRDTAVPSSWPQPQAARTAGPRGDGARCRRQEDRDQPRPAGLRDRTRRVRRAAALPRRACPQAAHARLALLS